PYVLDWVFPPQGGRWGVTTPTPPAPPPGPPLPQPPVASPPAGLPRQMQEEAKPIPVPAQVAKPEPTPPSPPAAVKATQVIPKPPAEPKPEVREGRPAEKGRYWIQVGSFRNASNADRLAAKLKAAQYTVRRTTRSRSVDGNHEVLVPGASKSEVDGKLLGRSYRTEASPDGVVIRSLPSLKEAVTLARELSREGFAVKIRRSRGSSALHVVRAGAYPSRKLAEEARAELAEKGFPGYVVKEAAN
ncbi:MAG: SPOR domain-containing protein, partial [Candidatus Methylomirabilia bacterium]